MFLRRTTNDPLDDESLVARLREGQRQALAALWDRYAHLLFGVCMKYLKDVERSKDLVLAQFEELPALVAKHEVRTFRPWLHAIMRNRCLMELRRKDPSIALDGHEPVDASQGEDRTLLEADLQQLERAITELPVGQQRCIRAFYFEKLSYRQVAERTGEPIDHVRSQLQNGRRNLRLILLRHGRNAH